MEVAIMMFTLWILDLEAPSLCDGAAVLLHEMIDADLTVIHKPEVTGRDSVKHFAEASHLLTLCT